MKLIFLNVQLLRLASVMYQSRKYTTNLCYTQLQTTDDNRLFCKLFDLYSVDTLHTKIMITLHLIQFSTRNDPRSLRSKLVSTIKRDTDKK